MTKAAGLERALRKRLNELRVPGVYEARARVPLRKVEINAIARDLLPWFWEVLESTEAETREACGDLP